MSLTATKATNKLRDLLTQPAGLAASIEAAALEQGLELAAITERQVTVQNVAAEIVERSTASKYPAVFLYCDRMVNELREKFRRFSGKVRLVVEVRVSQDRLEDLESQTQAYVDAVTAVLDAQRGDWGEGMFYAGGYDATFGAVKHGGRNYLQTGRVSFEVEVSR